MYKKLVEEYLAPGASIVSYNTNTRDAKLKNIAPYHAYRSNAASRNGRR